MIKQFFAIFLILISFLLFPPLAFAQDFTEEYYKAQVIKINEEGTVEFQGIKNDFQKVQLKILEGPEKDKEIAVNHGGAFKLSPEQKVQENDLVVVTKLNNPSSEPLYMISDKYRLNKVILLIVAFFATAILIAGKKGFGSIVGLGISLLVILNFMVPELIKGSDPILISLVGSLFIMLVTMYLSHGINRQTTIALIATFISLIVAALLGSFFVDHALLTGLGSEEAYLLQLGQNLTINLKGLLLGGIIIGTLGVLDDVTTTQTAAIFELHKTDPRQKFSQLFHKGLKIGKEHVSSVVNTLALAYAGASLPLFILFVSNPRNVPVWVNLNSEIVIEEVVRTLAGTFGLILAVPLTCLIAAWFASSRRTN